MQYTPHYNFNLPEGTDIVNPLVQDNPNYTAIDTELYKNKLRVVGTATHVKTGTNHAITLADSDINQFKFIATGDYATGDTFTVDGVTVTPRIANGSSITTGAFKINSTVLCILDGTILNLINVDSVVDSEDVTFDNSGTNLSASDVENAIKEVNAKTKEFYIANLDFSTVGDLNTWVSESVSGLWFITGTYAINQYGAYFDNFTHTLYDIAGSFNGSDTTVSAKAIGNNYIGGYARCYIILQRV